MDNKTWEEMQEYVKELEFKRKVGVPENAKPIADYDSQYGLGDVLQFVPLCPHCLEWSYYTTNDADRNGGYTLCPFCGGAMYDRNYFNGISKIRR